MGLFNRKEKRSFFPENQITINSALLFSEETNPTVTKCVDKIANTLATLPINLYSHSKSGKKLAVGHPLFHLLEHPAYEETPVLWYSTLIRHILLKGNAFIYLGRDSKGTVVNLSLCEPSKVKVQRDNNFRKIFNIDGKIYTERDILHIPYLGKGYNGTRGFSPVQIHKDVIDLNNKLLNYINAYFDNSLGTRYALELGEFYNNREMDKTYATILPFVNKFVSGANNAGKLMITPPDSKLSKIEQTSNVQAQLDSLLNFTENQIIGAFGIPYEIINPKENKYDSLENRQADFLANCVQPLGNHICQSFMKLIDAKDNNLFVEYDYKHMLKTDTKSTVEYLRTEVQSGLLSVNEARSKLGMTSIEDPVGDYYFIPANLMPLKKETVDAYMAKQKLALEETQHATTIGDDKV